MRTELICVVLAAVVIGGGCTRTGSRSHAGMVDEKAKLEKELARLTAEYEKTSALTAELQAKLDRAREAGEEMRLALAYRDRLRSELEGLRAEGGGEGWATVAEGGSGQVRRTVGSERTTEGKEKVVKGGDKRPGPVFSADYKGPTKIHVVKAGECLYKIAGYSQYFGNPDDWVYIYQVNEDRIRDPHWIFVGQPLKIPVF